MTGGEVEISVGMINGLCEEFSGKTTPEKKRNHKRTDAIPCHECRFYKCKRKREKCPDSGG